LGMRVKLMVMPFSVFSTAFTCLLRPLSSYVRAVRRPRERRRRLTRSVPSPPENRHTGIRPAPSLDGFTTGRGALASSLRPGRLSETCRHAASVAFIRLYPAEYIRFFAVPACGSYWTHARFLKGAAFGLPCLVASRASSPFCIGLPRQALDDQLDQ